MNAAANLTPTEIREACVALARKVGPKADVSICLGSTGNSASLYTKGVCGDRSDIGSFHVFVSAVIDSATALGQLEREWLAEQTKRNDRLIEKIALDIIRLTAEFGQCADAALRAEFGPLSVELSEAAVSKANEMASNGPFEIVALARANAA